MNVCLKYYTVKNDIVKNDIVKYDIAKKPRCDCQLMMNPCQYGGFFAMPSVRRMVAAFMNICYIFYEYILHFHR